MTSIDSGAAAGVSTQVSVAWTFTETYRRKLPLQEVADAARRSADEAQG